jgi:hypothetical protein
MTGFPINPPRTALVDANGLPTREWWIYFLNIQQAIGSGASSPFDDSALLAHDADAYLAGFANLPADQLIPPTHAPVAFDDFLAPNYSGLLHALYASVASGTYTPTLSNVANLDASTAYVCQYLRVGETVTVSGRVDINPTAAATTTQLGITLPVASNFASSFQCAGTAFAFGVAGQGAAIIGDTANDRAEMQWVSGDVTNMGMFFQFSYRVI